MNSYMPHGHCYLWEPGLVWTHVTTDALIGLAYISISITLYALVRKIRLPFSPMFIAFGIFIGACGLTHFMEIWTLWYPDYWMSAFFKGVTAVASVVTAIVLIPLVAKIVKFAEAASLSEERRKLLEQAHIELTRLYDDSRESEASQVQVSNQTDQLLVLVNKLREQKTEAERVNRVKSMFLSLVSHELNTPFAAMHLSVQMLAKEVSQLTERQKTLVMHLESGSKQLKNLIEGLLEYVRGGNALRVESIRLKSFVAESVQEVASLARQKNLEIKMQDGDDVLLQTDPRKLRIVLNNLLVNAVKFTEKGSVEVSFADIESGVQISVIDTGSGISDEDKERIFQPFEQVEPLQRKTTPGVGLGLALVRQLVSDLKGTVGLESQKHQGTTFYIRLPKAAV